MNVADIFKVIGDAVTAFVGVLANCFNSIVSIFYAAGSDGGAGKFTFVGILLLVGAGVGLVYWVFYLIMKLCRVNVK